MEIEEARTIYRTAREERYIMQLCQKRAYEIVGELICSDDDHTEETVKLEEMIQVWERQEETYKETMDNITASMKANAT